MRKITAILAIGAASAMTLGSTVPRPGVTLAPASGGQFTLSITNGVSYANYELHRRLLLDPGYVWEHQAVGSQGQTNFTIDPGILHMAFYEVSVGTDWDQDSIPNTQDADPSDAGVGQLTVYIDSPLHNSTID